MDGFQAMFMFAEHARTRDRVKKRQLRQHLIAYNGDDLEQLLGVHLKIRDLLESTV